MPSWRDPIVVYWYAKLTLDTVRWFVDKVVKPFVPQSHGSRLNMRGGGG